MGRLYTTIIGFGTVDQFVNPSVLLLEVTQILEGVVVWLEGATEQNNYHDSTPAYLVLNQVGYYRFQFTKVESIITLTLTYPILQLESMVMDVEGETFSFEMATLGAIRADWWWNDPDVHEIVPAGTKINNVG